MSKYVNSVKTNKINIQSLDNSQMIISGGVGVADNIYSSGAITCTNAISNDIFVEAKVNNKSRTTSISTNLDDDNILSVTGTATITLPDITNSEYDGVSYTIVKQTANTVTLTTQTADKIHKGGSDIDNVLLDGTIGESITVISNGDKWFTLDSDKSIGALIAGTSGTSGIVTHGTAGFRTHTTLASATFFDFQSAPTFTDIGGYFTTTTVSEPNNSPRFTCNVAGTYEFEFSFMENKSYFVNFVGTSVHTLTNAPQNNLGGYYGVSFIKTLSGNSPVATFVVPYDYGTVFVQTFGDSSTRGALDISLGSMYASRREKQIFTLAVGDMVNICLYVQSHISRGSFCHNFRISKVS